MAGAGGIRAGAAFVEVWLNDSKLVRGLKRMQMKLRAFGTAVTGIGMQMMMAGGAIAAPLVLAVRQFAKAGDELEKMASRTGISVQALSEMKFATIRAGSSIQDFEKGIQRMQRSLLDAERGLTTPIAALDELGLSVDDLKGKKPDRQFTILAEALKNVEDPGRRAAIAMMVFGRGGAKLLPLLNEGAAGIDKLRKRARDLGLTFDSKTAAAAAGLTDALAEVWEQVKAVAFHIGAAFGSELSGAANNVAEFMSKIIDWIKENRGLIVAVAKITGVVLAAGVALVVVGSIFSAMGAVIGGVIAVFAMAVAIVAKVGAILAWLMTPMGLLATAFDVLKYVIMTRTQAGKDAMASLAEGIQQLKNDALDAWAGMGDALAAGDISLAAKILWLTLKMEWQKGVHFLNGLWQSSATFFSKTWTFAVFGAAKQMTNANASISQGWTETVGFLEDVWASFVAGFVSTWNDAVALFKRTWNTVKGLMDDRTTAEVALEDERIQAEAAKKNKEVAEDWLSGIGERDKARRKKLAGIEEQRTGALEILDSETTKRNAERDRKHAAGIAGTQKSLDGAKADWQAALKSAKDKRVASDTDSEERKLESLEDKVKRWQEDGAGMGLARAASEQRGTFSAFAVRGMQGGGPVERIAKASEKTAENTGSIDEQLAEQRGVLFSN